MKAVAVIPSRYGSTRFPAKPLASRTGKYLVQHVYERVAACPQIARTVVATDDERIVQAVRSFGGEAMMTRADHGSGTDRVAEVAERLEQDDASIVLNVQGDEPEVDTGDLGRLVERLAAADGAEIATLAIPFEDNGPKAGQGSPLDPGCVKVVVGEDGRALYFSRSLIPYPRSTGGVIDRPSRWLLHLGVYGFRARALRDATEKGREPAADSDAGLEAVESLEQLGWLRRGMDILVVPARHRSWGIDTPEDYAAFVERQRPGPGTTGSDSQGA